MRRQSKSQLCLERQSWITQQDQGLRSSPSCNNPLDIDEFWVLLCVSLVLFSLNDPCAAERQLPASATSISSLTSSYNDPAAERHREETDWAKSLHSQGCSSEDAAAQLQGPHRYSGEEGRERGKEELAPLRVPDSSTATSCLEPWCRIANDHAGCSHSSF